MFCLFGRCKKEQKATPVKPKLGKAKEVSEQYENLKNCCDVLSTLNGLDDFHTLRMSVYSGGWKIGRHTLENAGVDIDKVYGYIELLVLAQKKELEAKLEKLGA